MKEYMFDTWAWMEFYDGSRIGEEAYRILESDKTVYTSKISIAELSDNYHRGNLETDHSWNQIKGFVESKSQILNLTPETLSEAGKIKKNQREQHPDFGLMDAIILATARQKNLKLLTGDPHLTTKDISEDIRKK